VDDVTPPKPDNDLIAQTAGQVDQKAAPPVDAPPNADVPPTGVTAVDGTVTNATIAEVSATRRRDVGRFGKRQSGFEKVFDGKPADQKDASIEGTAYLTYTVVPNSTYNVQACLDWAAKIDGCGEFLPLTAARRSFLLPPSVSVLHTLLSKHHISLCDPRFILSSLLIPAADVNPSLCQPLL
jgi:hypothetical protein